jgi:hypothetical protein
MINAMVKINKETQERELLWTPDMSTINPEEEIIAALAHFDDEPYTVNWADGTSSITGKHYHIFFEPCF